MKEFKLTSTEGYYIRQFLDSVRNNVNVIGVYAVAFKEGDKQVCQIHCYTDARRGKFTSYNPDDDIEEVWDAIATLSKQIPNDPTDSREITVMTDNQEAQTEEFGKAVVKFYRNLLSSSILLDPRQELGTMKDKLASADGKAEWNQPWKNAVPVDASSVYEKEDGYDYSTDAIDNDALGFDCDGNPIYEGQVLRAIWSNDEDIENLPGADPRHYCAIVSEDGEAYAISVYDHWRYDLIREREGLGEGEEVPVIVKPIAEMDNYEIAYEGNGELFKCNVTDELRKKLKKILKETTKRKTYPTHKSS